MYQMAAALDPRFKLDWCFTDFERQSNTFLIRLGKSVNLNLASGSNPESSSHSPPKKRIKLFSFMSSTREIPRSELSLENEVKDYFADAILEEEKDQLQFWKTKESLFPTLATLAKKYLCVPASSALVEKVFSIAGKVFHPDRCSLSDSTSERLMLVKCNKIF